ncbi:hypothetical protein HN903_00020 [archaeon]|jgi:hypothetical protein|nr:hypothetical protein [archaeon]MBT6956311.1 hypothetical protein [archaeon]MBT7128122.1 hypothetical protein [archaeon]
MKRSLVFLILITLSLQLVQSSGVGITPVYYKEFFEPGLTKTYSFHAFATNSEDGVDLYIKGDLAEYVTLSTDHLPDGGNFKVEISLPDEIAIPGTHKIYVGAIEASGAEGAMVGGIAAIQGRIDILVPYPGKYAQSIFKMSNINQGEEAPYELEIQSLGTESIIVNPKIEVHKIGSTEVIITEKFPEINMESKETQNINGMLKTKELPPGEYIAYATIEWGETTILNQTFRVGEFLVDIVDYDYEFEQGKINPFRIEVENKWNTRIEEVFATVSITDAGTLITDFKTVSVDTKPWEIKNITGYFDTTNLEAKRYTAKIILSYDGATTSKLVAIYVHEPSSKTYMNYIIIASIVAILIFTIFIYLIWKVNKLSNQNGKKK